ncbi:MAG: S-methyl-5-thioribose-1-phosphate isomerase [Proteobacteria bacterium]|nr:S-methyl-5-thioribose-1-phosphate isomerase [Pseudomonadota bacterium]
MTLSSPSFETVYWKDDAVVLIDQRLLPHEETYRSFRDVAGVAEAIANMTVRGAPAIGVTAAFGVALAARQFPGDEAAILRACDQLAATRPTAVNLFWGIARMKACMRQHGLDPEVLLREAQAIRDEDIAGCRRMGDFGAAYLKDGDTVLTHCNAGALATAGWGSALGVIRSAVAMGKRIRVIADETRPLFQGARLTAWELAKDGIDVTVIADGAAASVLARGLVDAVVVGADRIAANGDVANKIGTYGVALAAHAHRIPFYVAAPFSTVDLACPSGAQIPIEERAAAEVSHVAEHRVLAAGVNAMNPAFDVTPSHLITAIFTDNGVALPPFDDNLARLANAK